MIDLTNKRAVIFGLQQTGKSCLIKNAILPKVKRHFVFDTLNEYQGFNRYIVQNRDKDGIPELEKIAELVVAQKADLFIIDEANRYLLPKPTPLPQQISAINDFQAHMGLAFICVCRRPVQLHQDITELAHYIISFNLVGKNDISYLNAVANGLGDKVANLQGHEFLIAGTPRYEATIYNPLPLGLDK